MRDPSRIEEIINLLRKGWAQMPDWRFGQIIENLKRYIGKEDLFYVEDDEFVNYLIDYFDLDEDTTE